METPRKFLPVVNDEFVPRDFGLQTMLQEKSGPPASSQAAAS